MIHKKKFFRGSSVKHRTFSELEVIYISSIAEIFGPFLVRKLNWGCNFGKEGCRGAAPPPPPSQKLRPWTTFNVYTQSFSTYKIKPKRLVNDPMNDMEYLLCTLLELCVCNKEKKINASSLIQTKIKKRYNENK